MRRRQFLTVLFAAALAMGPSRALAFFGSPKLTGSEKALLEGLLIIEAHAHPDKCMIGAGSRDHASSLEAGNLYRVLQKSIG